MRYTTHLNLPVPEEDDQKSDFPLEVDGPRMDALDDELAQFGTLGRRIMSGVAQTDANGEYTFTWAAGVWASTPQIILTPIEITGASMRVRGGAKTTTATVRADNNSNASVPNCWFNYIIIGARGTAPHPSL